MLLTPTDLAKRIAKDKCIQKLSLQLQEVNNLKGPSQAERSRAWRKVMEAYVEYLPLAYFPATQGKLRRQIIEKMKRRAVMIKQVGERMRLKTLRGRAGYSHLQAITIPLPMTLLARSLKHSSKAAEEPLSAPPPSSGETIPPSPNASGVTPS